MNRRLWVLLFNLLPCVLGCQEMIYPSRVEVPFASLPGVIRGAEIVLDGKVVGTVGDIVQYSDRVGVVVHVATDVLPERAVFLATTNNRGRGYLDVYRVPKNLHAARGPYWGATSNLELAAYLGRERADAIWSATGTWLLNRLRDPGPSK